MPSKADKHKQDVSLPAVQPRSVCMFVYNTFTHDARVLKEAQTLAGAGYQVTVAALHNKDEEFPAIENQDGFVVIRFPKKPVHLRLFACLRAWQPLNVLFGKEIRGVDKKDIPVASPAGQENKPAPADKKWSLKYLTTVMEKRVFRVAYALLRRVYAVLRLLIRKLSRFVYSMAVMTLMPFHRQLCFLDFYLRTCSNFRDMRFDIYHAHDLNMLPVAWWFARRHRARLVYDSHEYYLERNMPKPYSKLGRLWRRWVEGYLVRATDLNITVNDTIARELAARYKVEPFKVIMNTPSRTKDFEEKEECDLRRLLNISPDHYILLYLGAITFNRGLECVIESLRHLPDCQLVLMGMGRDDYKAKLVELAVSAGVKERMHFFGPVPSRLVTSYARTADVGIAAIRNACLSYYYCSPNKVFEYVLSGLPVVASDFPELRKVVLDYQVGLTFDPDDPRDIAKQIRYVLDHAEFRENVRKNIPAAAEAFNWENESRKLLDYYAQLQV